MPDQPSAPAPLPEETPERLKAFVSCEVDTVLLNESELGFIPSGDFGEFGLKPGFSPPPAGVKNAATVTYGNGTFAVTIGSDGELVVDTSSLAGIPGLSEVGEGAQNWVKAFNATMKRSDKNLKMISVENGNVSIVKGPATPPTKSDSEADPKLVTVGGTGQEAGGKSTPASPPAPTPAPVTPSLWQRFVDWLGSFISMLISSPMAIFGALGVLALILIGLFAALTGGGDDTIAASTDSPSNTAPAGTNGATATSNTSPGGTVPSAVPDNLKGAEPTGISDIGDGVIEVKFAGNARSVLEDASLADARVDIHLNSGTVRISLGYQQSAGEVSTRSIRTDSADAKPTEDGGGTVTPSTLGSATAEWKDDSTLHLRETKLDIPPEATRQVQVLIMETPNTDYYSMAYT